MSAAAARQPAVTATRDARSDGDIDVQRYQTPLQQLGPKVTASFHAPLEANHLYSVIISHSQEKGCNPHARL